MQRPRSGLIALSIFFALGALIAAVAAIALVASDGPLAPIWRLNPQAHVVFLAIGPWAPVVMVVVATACALSAIGLWIRAPWGHRLALVLLVVNLAGDATNAVVRRDLRTLIGLPIAGALIFYLLSARVRGQFRTTDAAA